MNFIAFFFIISTFYYLINRSHLQKTVEQKLIMYDSKKWIMFDIIYYLHIIFYWVWLFTLLFTRWECFSIILLILSFSKSISYWIFRTKYDLAFSIIKIIILFSLIVAPFF
jgi:hypothetical protein